MFGQYKEGVTIKWLIKEDFQIDLIKNKTKYFSYFPFTKRDSITFLLLSILCANHRYFQQSNIQAIHWWVFLVLIHSLIHEYCKDQNVALSFILKGSVIDETNLLFWWTTTKIFILKILRTQFKSEFSCPTHSFSRHQSIYVVIVRRACCVFTKVEMNTNSNYHIDERKEWVVADIDREKNLAWVDQRVEINPLIKSPIGKQIRCYFATFKLHHDDRFRQKKINLKFGQPQSNSFPNGSV